jgi:hypothetical protein
METVIMVKMGTDKVCVLVIAALGLSGCGGSTSAVPDGNVPDGEGGVQEDNTYVALLAEMMALDAALSPFVPSAAMQNSGSATFDGVASLKPLAALNPELLSRFNLTAQFADDTVSGELFDFADADGSPITGTVDLENGAIAGNALSFDMNGSLTRDGKAVVVAGTGQGNFGGEGPTKLLGGLVGTTKEEANPVVPITGIFAAIRVP